MDTNRNQSLPYKSLRSQGEGVKPVISEDNLIILEKMGLPKQESSVNQNSQWREQNTSPNNSIQKEFLKQIIE